MNRKWTGTKWAERENKGEMGDKRRWERGGKKRQKPKRMSRFPTPDLLSNYPVLYHLTNRDITAAFCSARDSFTYLLILLKQKWQIFLGFMIFPLQTKIT